MKNIFLKNEITLDFVGDSVTYGQDHCEPDQTYVARFAYYLSQITDKSVYRYDNTGFEWKPNHFEGPFLVKEGHGGKIDVIKNGVCGNSVMRAYRRIDDFTGILANGKEPDITFTMFGINDALASDPSKFVTVEQYKENYRNLLREIKLRNPNTQFVMIAATFNDQCIDEYCEASLSLAKEENIPYIDAHRLWSEHHDPNEINFGHGDWLAGGSDACHPTPKSAEVLARFIFDEFVKLLR